MQSRQHSCTYTNNFTLLFCFLDGHACSQVMLVTLVWCKPGVFKSFQLSFGLVLMPLSSGAGCMLRSICQPKPTIPQTFSLLLMLRCGLSDSITQAEGIQFFLLSNRLIVQELLQTEQFSWYPSTHKLLPSQGNCQECVGSRVLGMA